MARALTLISSTFRTSVSLQHFCQLTGCKTLGADIPLPGAVGEVVWLILIEYLWSRYSGPRLA